MQRLCMWSASGGRGSRSWSTKLPKTAEVHKSQMSLYPVCGIRSDNSRYALQLLPVSAQLPKLLLI